MSKQITPEIVQSFLEGHDPMERIVAIECAYNEDRAAVIYVNKDGQKRVRMEDFKPFLWCKNSAAIRLFGGNRGTLKKKMREYGISVKALQTHEDGKDTPERLENGYKYMFYATRRMSNSTFQNFFTEGGVPVHPKTKKGEPEIRQNEYCTIPAVEQFMISTGKRFFKGWTGYDEVTRLLFDLETQGLNPRIHRIDQIGIRTNKGFERILTITGDTEEEKDKCELAAIITFISIIAEIKPDVIAGHNSENFDWDFIITRCQMLGTSLEDITLKYFKHPIYKQKKPRTLKLGGEMEYFYPTIMWGHTILDSLHAVRRAQAVDSSFKSASLKYATKYLKLKKPNRVYVPGNKITETWNITDEVYAFNNHDGDWYKISEQNILKDGYEKTSGRYIVERYLLDDIWETDKVELTLNEVNFQLAKILPTSFGRACTMGTAAVWKLIMLGWCYENDLAIPATAPGGSFTGGISMALKLGIMAEKGRQIVKLDYNSLYPSIILTWNVNTPLDITHVMFYMLDYMLTYREKYKNLKKDAAKNAEKLSKELEKYTGEEKEIIEAKINEYKAAESANDKKQSVLKVTGNGYFGSFGAENIFNFGDIKAAEKTTCIGRMLLRLMIYHFSNISKYTNDTDYNYEPIVGDTDGFNFLTPLKYRYTDENPYVSKGLGRNTVSGKKYTYVEADVAEFEDLFLTTSYNGGIQKYGLGIDEVLENSLQLSRKNYADLMLDGSIKFVGNSIKSRKMSAYLEEFINENVNTLLHCEGKKFLDNYYDYIDRIYNYQIPIRDIASKGNIKKSLDEYLEDMKTLTKGGSKKSRQAWYELALRSDAKINVSDTIFYVNTGKKGTDSDVKRVTHQFIHDENGNEIELIGKVKTQLLKAELEKGYTNENGETIINIKDLKTADKKIIFAKYIVREEDEIILNCKMVPQYILDDETHNYLCSEVDGLEYNVDKYIDQFNNRVKPLLVCFSKNIRNKILVKNPEDRKYFTEEEAKLVSGEPNDPADQDTYEALMTPQRKEIAFWTKIGEIPPFVKECNIDWDALVEQYKIEKKQEEDAEFQEENTKYLDALESLTDEEVNKFEEEGELPSKITNIMTLGSDMYLYFKRIPNKKPSTGGYIFDDIKRQIIDTVDDFGE